MKELAYFRLNLNSFVYLLDLVTSSFFTFFAWYPLLVIHKGLIFHQLSYQCSCRQKSISKYGMARNHASAGISIYLRYLLKSNASNLWLRSMCLLLMAGIAIGN